MEDVALKDLRLAMEKQTDVRKKIDERQEELSNNIDALSDRAAADRLTRAGEEERRQEWRASGRKGNPSSREEHR